MRGIIIANGEISNNKIISQNLKTEDIIICCDGGANYAFNEGITPNYIIGDLDSASFEIIQFFESKGVKLKKFNSKKDETDMELAIDFCIDIGLKEILIFGALGTRFDHSFANVNLLVKPLLANISAKIINENNEIILINDFINLKGEIGANISLLPLSSEVFGINTYGLEYALENFDMKIGTSLGVSNVMTSENVKISIKKGYLLIIKARD